MSIRLFCDQCQSEIDPHGNRYSLSTNYASLDFDKTECITDWLDANSDPGSPTDPPAEDPPAEPPADPDPAPDATLDPTADPEPGSTTETRYRDAVTGAYVTAEYAAEHPDTTVAETD
jgi:hypothetical protein